jgi:hypothetical protein
MFELIPYVQKSIWNKGKLVGQKLPLKLEETWAIRIRRQLSNNLRGLAMFNLALDSKLRAFDLIKLKVRYIAHCTWLSYPTGLRLTTFAFAHWQSVICNYYCKRHTLC